jgi:hypothetical protein
MRGSEGDGSGFRGRQVVEKKRGGLYDEVWLRKV